MFCYSSSYNTMFNAFSSKRHFGSGWWDQSDSSIFENRIWIIRPNSYPDPKFFPWEASSEWIISRERWFYLSNIYFSSPTMKEEKYEWFLLQIFIYINICVNKNVCRLSDNLYDFFRILFRNIFRVPYVQEVLAKYIW